MTAKQYPQFSEARHRLVALVVSKNKQLAVQLRQALLAAGFRDAATVSSYELGLERLQEEEARIDAVFFQGETPEGSGFDVFQFIKEVKACGQKAPLLAISENPVGDHWFALLKAGVKGFLLPPVTPSSIENVIAQMQEGVMFKDEILEADDRNAKFVELLQYELDYYCDFLRHSRTEAVAPEEKQRRSRRFSTAVNTARFFCEKSEVELMRAFRDYLEQRAEVLDKKYSDTNIARTRELLKQQRLQRKKLRQ